MLILRGHRGEVTTTLPPVVIGHWSNRRSERCEFLKMLKNAQKCLKMWGYVSLPQVKWQHRVVIAGQSDIEKAVQPTATAS